MVLQVTFFLIPNQKKMTPYFALHYFILNPKEPKILMFITQQICQQTNNKADGLRPNAHQINLKNKKDNQNIC